MWIYYVFNALLDVFNDLLDVFNDLLDVFNASLDVFNASLDVFTSEIQEEKDFLEVTTSEEKVVIHFYHEDFRRCAIMDNHLKVNVHLH